MAGTGPARGKGRYSTALSAQNVEIVRRSMEAFSRRDLDAFLAALDPDTEWRTAADEPNPETYRGHDGVRRFAAEISEPWEGRFDDVMEFDDFVDLEEWVVVPVEEGRIVRIDEFRTRQGAIDAVRSRGDR
jgi:hypothetical protein